MFFLLFIFSNSVYENEFVELQNEWPSADVVLETIYTVLFSKGRIMKEINKISDAIVHSRSGCGIDVPAGPGLYYEMKNHSTYKNIFNFEDGAFITYLKNQVIISSKKFNEGTIKNLPSMHYICQCFTLGGYGLYLNYSIPYKCINIDNIKKCHVEGTMHMEGADKWDFEELPSYTWWQNLIREKIPEWLVKIHGKNMKPFYTKYSIDIPYSFDLEI